MYTFVTRLRLEIPGKRIGEVLEALLQRYQDHYLPHISPELASGSPQQQLVELLQLCGYDASYHQDSDVLHITDCDVEQLDSARDPVLCVLEGVTPAGSFVEFYGDDNSQWRLHYDATHKWVVAGQVMFPQESDALLAPSALAGERLPISPLHRDYLLAHLREQNTLTLALLDDLNERLTGMRYEINLQYVMCAYHPALPHLWQEVEEAYQNAEGQMHTWLTWAAAIPQETYQRLEEEALQEARARNRGLKVGDTVVLLNSWWEDENFTVSPTGGNQAIQAPTFARGQHMVVTELWDRDDYSEKDLSLEEVTTVVLVRTPDEEGGLEVSLTTIGPLAAWEAREPERLSDLITQLPFELEVVPITLDEVPEAQRLPQPAPSAWRYQLSLEDFTLQGYAFGKERPAPASVLRDLLSRGDSSHDALRYLLGNVLYERFQHATRELS